MTMEYHIYAKGKTFMLLCLAQRLCGSVHAFGGTEQSQISSESSIVVAQDNPQPFVHVMFPSFRSFFLLINFGKLQVCCLINNNTSIPIPL